MTYFGHEAGTYPDATDATYVLLNGAVAFTCPGSGTQDIKSLGCYGKSNGGTPGNFRCAIYDTSYNLIAQHSAEVEMSGTTPSWQGESQGLTGTLVLTGGVNYKICVTFDSNDCGPYFSIVPDGDGAYLYGSDLTGGFPAVLDTPFGFIYLFNVRCGVDPAGGGDTYTASGVISQSGVPSRRINVNRTKSGAL